MKKKRNTLWVNAMLPENFFGARGFRLKVWIAPIVKSFLGFGRKNCHGAL
jgi:hypothetical protein